MMIELIDYLADRWARANKDDEPYLGEIESKTSRRRLSCDIPGCHQFATSDVTLVFELDDEKYEDPLVMCGPHLRELRVEFERQES
jgi:hypothetical protein